MRPKIQNTVAQQIQDADFRSANKIKNGHISGGGIKLGTLNCQVLCVFLGLTWSGITIAQTSEEEDLVLAYGDQSNVSIATGSHQPISKAPSSASVITAEDIQAMGATDLDQALESVPGVHVSMSNFNSIRFTIFGVSTPSTVRKF